MGNSGEFIVRYKIFIIILLIVPSKIHNLNQKKELRKIIFLYLIGFSKEYFSIF